MRIFDEESDRTLGSIHLLLTREDVAELILQLRSLESDVVGGHMHVDEPHPASADCAREITLSLYEEGSVPRGWSERFGRIVQADE